MTDNVWPMKCRDKADGLLEEELIYLSCELGMYIDLAPEEAPDGKVQYEAQLSGIFLRLGRCQIYAEITEYTALLTVINQIIASLCTLLNNINYKGAMDDVRDAHAQFIGELAVIKNKAQHAAFTSMGDYKEE